MEFAHETVLLKEAVELLAVDPDGIYVDGTLGGGGHSEALLKRLSGRGRLIGIDRDEEALRAAGDRLSPFGERFCPVHGDFRDLSAILKALNIEKVTGILLDLGVSSHQFDDPERGFSYRGEGTLDMRMDRQETGLTAYDIVNHWEKRELIRILREYGEERFAKQIADGIVRERKGEEIRTTLQLSGIIAACVPARFRASGNPARQTFQALRIAVNGELEALEEVLEQGIPLLSPGGRMAVITFHSLEDRRVKEAFRKAENPCTCPPDFPVCVCGRISLGRVLTRKPILPGQQELETNRRARSAKLRAFQRVQE